MSEPESSKGEKWSFKIVGFQLKNEDKVAVDNWTAKLNLINSQIFLINGKYAELRIKVCKPI